MKKLIVKRCVDVSSEKEGGGRREEGGGRREEGGGRREEGGGRREEGGGEEYSGTHDPIDRSRFDEITARLMQGMAIIIKFVVVNYI